MAEGTGVADPETGSEEMTEAERRAQAEGRKKHSRPVITIQVDGQTVHAEKVWGSVLLPKDIVGEFGQYCRDIGRKSSEVIADIIREGLVPVFAEMEATKATRDAARSVKKVASDEATLIKQAEKLAADEAKMNLRKAAIKARAAEIRAQKGEGGVDPLNAIHAILGEPEPETAPTNGKTAKGKK